MKHHTPYRTAEELGIEQWEHDGLAALVGPLSRDGLPFDMGVSCGSVCCIGGWVATLAGKSQLGYMYSVVREPHVLGPLYYPEETADCNPYDATAPQAARAVVNFLTLGDPRWADVMREG